MHQHRRHATCRFFYALLDRVHDGGVTHQGSDSFILLGQRTGRLDSSWCSSASSGYRSLSWHSRNALHRRGHHHAKLLRIHRLGHVIKRTPAQRLHRIFGRAISGDDNAALIALLLAQLAERERAQQGVYRSDQLKGLSEERLHRFFLRGTGSNEGMVRVRPQLQQPIEFMNINLIDDDWPFKTPLDVVFCRNVMIYFDAPTQRRVLERIHRVMKPGGTLFVGHAENFSESRDLFVLRGKTVYERV